MSMKAASTGTMITRSVLLHGAALLAMNVAAPHLEKMPDGTKQTTVEIIHKTSPPKGQQVREMEPTPLVQSAPEQQMAKAPVVKAKLAKAPVVAKPKPVIPKVEKMQPREIVARPTPKKAKPKAKAVAALTGSKVKDMDGDTAARIERERKQKLAKELEELKA